MQFTLTKIKIDTASIIKDYAQLTKVRLTLSVVISALLGFLIMANETTNYLKLIPLFFGGWLVVAASNGINQVIERNYDKLMIRTQNRPVAQQRISVLNAILFSSFLGLVGVIILGKYLSPINGLLGLISLALYAFFYTPSKRITKYSVYIGAIPGAIPPLIGCIAATGGFTVTAWVLFGIQFIWQFPHFWSIAWVLDDDYKRAGYRMLPSDKGRGKASAVAIFISSFILTIAGVVPYFMGLASVLSLFVALIAGGGILFFSYKLLRTQETKQAKQVMFISIIYNTLVLFSYMS